MEDNFCNDSENQSEFDKYLERPDTQNALCAEFLTSIFKMASVDVLYGVIFVLFLTSLSLASVPSERHVKFQYKHSFKGPHLVNKEGAIPFWNHGGSK